MRMLEESPPSSINNMPFGYLKTPSEINSQPKSSIPPVSDLALDHVIESIVSVEVPDGLLIDLAFF